MIYTYAVGDDLRNQRWNNDRKALASCSMDRKQDHRDRHEPLLYHQSSRSIYHKMMHLGINRQVWDNWSLPELESKNIYKWTKDLNGTGNRFFNTKRERCVNSFVRSDIDLIWICQKVISTGSCTMRIYSIKFEL